MAIYERVCIRCSVKFEGGPRAWYCPICRKDRERERAAKYNKHPSKRKIGSKDRCDKCGKEYIVCSGMQKYCEKCRPEMMKKIDAKQSLEYYQKNKKIINPKRYEARKNIGKRCEICGKDFYSKTCTKYCSKECADEARKSKARMIYEKRRKEKEKNNDN